MRTDLPAELMATEQGQRADAILRSCVHCGFCNATCPTYRLLGDELDGPRGRIYLIKDMLETGEASRVTRTHLDRCLTCRACETTCPSGVRYGELLEIGREHLESRVRRFGVREALRRWLLAVVPYPQRFAAWLQLGRRLQPWLPSRLARALPPPASADLAVSAPRVPARRKVLILDGCVQRHGTPVVNAALAELLGRRGIELVRAPEEGCCGSLALHLGERRQAEAAIAANVAALAPLLDQVDTIVSTASGCGVTVKDYGRLLAGDAASAEQAQRIANMTVDVAEFLDGLGMPFARRGDHRRVAWHSPCTLQHGQRVVGPVERLLQSAGYELVEVADSHLCCGSAGSYSILEPDLAGRLRDDKLAALQRGQPDVIATANVGCQLHLAGAAEIPVVHWLELLR